MVLLGRQIDRGQSVRLTLTVFGVNLLTLKNRVPCGPWRLGGMARIRQWTVLIASSLILLSGCNSTKKPNERNLRSAIDQYLVAHGTACVAVDGQFPIDVPAVNWNDKSGEAAELAALEHAGIVQSSDTTAIVHSLANSLSLSPHKPQPVKRYTVSGEGQKYF